MKIAVLTSGGDAPGMNAAIRAVVRTSIYNNIEVFGVQYGYSGLIEDKIMPLDIFSVADKIQRGGTFLYTARCKEMFQADGVKKAADTLKKHDIDGLIVIGGDGSFLGAKALSKYGINVIGIPGTIDNDITSTDYTIGFDTATNTVIDAISKIRDTSHSHNRVNIVEVMGRRSGNLALAAGIAGGAEAIIVPEMEYSVEAVIEKMTKGKDRGKLHSIVVFAEGAGDLKLFTQRIKSKTDIETRTTILGYIQRGGSPTAFDRILASRMGSMAVELLINGKCNKVVCIRDNKYIDVDIDEALAIPYMFDKETYEVAMQLSI